MKTVQMGPISTFKRRATHLALGLGLAATLAFGAVMPAMAADPGLTITGGALTAAGGAISYNIDSAGYTTNGNAITLNGAAHSILFQVPVDAADYTGADLGWHTTLSLGQFTTGSVLLGETALSVTAAGNATCDTTDSKVCSGGNAAVTNHVAPTTYTTGAAAMKVFKTDATTHVPGVAMGQYDYTTTFGFALPTTAKAGSYASTLTVTAVSAP